jgi:hypothetical protein
MLLCGAHVVLCCDCDRDFNWLGWVWWGGGGWECYTEHLFTIKTVLKIKYINSYVLQCLEQDLCRKCTKNIEKNPQKHECVHVVK